MATIGDQLLAPEAGWKRYDDSSGEFNYLGTEWERAVSSSYYNGTYTSTRMPNRKIKMNFIGTQLRIITTVGSNRASDMKISIDGSSESFSCQSATQTHQVIVYEKRGLENKLHVIEIESGTGGSVALQLDAIDIDSTGRLLHPDEVTEIKDLNIGKRIRCHYQAPLIQVGSFSGLGQETSDFIPVASSATPDGDFYFIMVENWNRKKILLADRNIQHRISWDTLNASGIASESGLPVEIDSYENLTLRLLTGGMSAADKDNEWDRYIVNSTLNDTITAGDNFVWNWSGVSTWTSTISTANASNRITRGNLLVDYRAANSSGSGGATIGFRPVLEVEIPILNKSFILFNGEYKKFDSSWQTVSTTLPAVDTFINEGMDDLSVFDRKETTLVFPMDDNGASGEVLGSGRIFKEKLDLKKYFEIKSINAK